MFRVDPKTVTRWAASGRIGAMRTPGVRIAPMRPDAARLGAVFGSTRSIRATSPGVSNRSLMSIVTGYLLVGPERCHGQRLMLILRRQRGSGVRPNYAFMSESMMAASAFGNERPPDHSSDAHNAAFNSDAAREVSGAARLAALP